MERRNALVELTFEFALDIISYSEQLESIKKFVIARQLLKSGTSIGANTREAQNAESLADFIHKLKMAAKESEESAYWLELCRHSENYPDCEHLIEKNNNIIKLLTAIISTSKSKLNRINK